MDLLRRAKFNCQCIDAILSKTTARPLSNWHLLNKKAKDKVRGQRDGALGSAWSTDLHRRAFWLQLLQINCRVREWASVSAFHNCDIQSISVKQKDGSIFLGALLSVTPRGNFSLVLADLVTAQINLLVLPHYFLSFQVQCPQIFPHFLLKVPARLILSVGILRRKM